VARAGASLTPRASSESCQILPWSVTYKLLFGHY
jgi:hypothetical protein